MNYSDIFQLDTDFNAFYKFYLDHNNFSLSDLLLQLKPVLQTRFPLKSVKFRFTCVIYYAADLFIENSNSLTRLYALNP